MQIPDLVWETTTKAVKVNRERIKAALAEVKAHELALLGLLKVNQGLCPHDRVRNLYDPGYGGGGYDRTECQDCGGRVPYRDGAG